MERIMAGALVLGVVALGGALWAKWGLAVSLAVDIAALCF